MMFDRPVISHQPPTPPGSPNPPSPSPSSPALAAAGGGVVRAELAQQANEVCQLVAKANRAPNGLHADELRRLLSDIHSLHLLAQQLSSSSSTTSSSSSSPSSSPSRGIAKKKPSHHAAVLSRPLAAVSSSPAWCATSSPLAPTAATTTTTTTSAAAAATAGRACHTPIRPRGHLPTAAAATATNATSGSSPCLSPEIGTGPRACTNCGTSTTVQWRCGADGKPSLCNACGLRFRYNLKKKALYEDIAVVRAMTQRSPSFAQHANNQHTHSSSSASSTSASPSSSASASRSTSPPPAVPSTAGCPPRPVPATISAPPADASGEARRSNIYSLLN